MQNKQFQTAADCVEVQAAQDNFRVTSLSSNTKLFVINLVWGIMFVCRPTAEMRIKDLQSELLHC